MPDHSRPTIRPSRPFVRALELTGWSARSVWGYDPDLECYWAELWRVDSDPAPLARVGVEHLITTVAGLAGAMATVAPVRDDDAYLALTA